MSRSRYLCELYTCQLLSPFTLRSDALTTVSRRRISSQATTNPKELAHLLPSDVLLEEEKNPDYDPKRFYPARIGKAINGKYLIISKLGFGTGSTV